MLLMVTKETAYSELETLLTGDSILRRHEPMSRHTTLRVGGPADLYVEPANEEELACVVRHCTESGLPYFMVGRGSNLLVRDEGIRGVVISLSNPVFTSIQTNEISLRCSAGARLKQVANHAREHGIAGLEFLEGIPGTLGGALRMNAGAMGSCLFDVAQTVRYMDARGGIHEKPGVEMAAQYRHCPFLENHLALGAVLVGRPDLPAAIGERMKQYSTKRWGSQPATPSAGCMFKNPTTIPAGKLVEEMGFKGLRVGNAMISDIHGNFIVNKGNATANDVLDLMNQVRERARLERGIDLELEVQIVGDMAASTNPVQSS